MATLGLSKVFILDKYFTELQKFWETEKKLQGKAVLGLYVAFQISFVSHIAYPTGSYSDEIRMLWGY
jgi:hypothetical protein